MFASSLWPPLKSNLSLSRCGAQCVPLQWCTDCRPPGHCVGALLTAYHSSATTAKISPFHRQQCCCLLTSHATQNACVLTCVRCCMSDSALPALPCAPCCLLHTMVGGWLATPHSEPSCIDKSCGHTHVTCSGVQYVPPPTTTLIHTGALGMQPSSVLCA